jgi:multisubunit Na+/H+ antiporter MnhF subunit
MVPALTLELYIMLLICIMSIGILFCLYRLFIGPSLAERTVAGDGVVSLIMGIFILTSVLRDSDIYFNAVLIISLLGFITTLTVARYLEFTDEE